MITGEDILGQIGLSSLKNVTPRNVDIFIEEREKALKDLDRWNRSFTAKESLLDFTLATFVKANFDMNWHVNVVCEKLQRLVDPNDPLNRLIITMPRRHTKSEICTRRFPAWVIGKNPRNYTVIVGAYSAPLAESFSRDIKGIIEGKEYKNIFPDVKLNPNYSGVKEWAVNKNSHASLITVGRGGSIVGRGGDLLVLDDPLKNIAEAKSVLILDSLFEWFSTTFRPCLQPHGSVLIVTTRWSEGDIIGRIKTLMEVDPEADRYEILNIPAIAEKDDDYRLEGEALHPERYPIDALLNLKSGMTVRMFNAIMQGNPTPPEGSRFKKAWFSPLISTTQLPKERIICRYWDWATTPEAGDFTVGTKCSTDLTYQKYVEHVVRGQWEWSRARQEIINTAKRDGKHVVIVIEEIAKDKTILFSLKKELRSMGFKVVIHPKRTNKEISAMYLEQLAQAGQVTLCRGVWNAAWLFELGCFPLGEHDDQVDSVSGGINHLRFVKPEDILKIKENELASWDAIEPVDAHRIGHAKARRSQKKHKITDIRDLV